jgi:DNA-binding transcriptional regulator YiaG
MTTGIPRDAQPLTDADLKRMRRTPRAKIIRRALDLTQEEFAARYHIPLGTLRDWEQGRAEPDRPTRAYLTLIARDPDHVNRTLKSEGELSETAGKAIRAVLRLCISHFVALNELQSHLNNLPLALVPIVGRTPLVRGRPLAGFSK